MALDRARVAYTLHPYVHDPADRAYGDEAATALGVDRERVFKTLVADTGGALVVAVVPVARQLDLKALAVAAGVKRTTLADPAVAARATGYVVGGISPLGQRTPLRPFLAASADRFATIFVSAGKRGLDVELAPAELARLTDAVTCALGV